MALFRFHRETLEESLKTTIIVKDAHELLEIIANWYQEAYFGISRQSMFQWQLYIDEIELFDPRCGWYTHRVSFQVRNSDFFIVGFLSEPLDKWKLSMNHNVMGIESAEAGV